jgi:hypothetical protein
VHHNAETICDLILLNIMYIVWFPSSWISSLFKAWKSFAYQIRQFSRLWQKWSDGGSRLKLQRLLSFMVIFPFTWLRSCNNFSNHNRHYSTKVYGKKETMDLYFRDLSSIECLPCVTNRSNCNVIWLNLIQMLHFLFWWFYDVNLRRPGSVTIHLTLSSNLKTLSGESQPTKRLSLVL